MQVSHLSKMDGQFFVPVTHGFAAQHVASICRAPNPYAHSTLYRALCTCHIPFHTCRYRIVSEEKILKYEDKWQGSDGRINGSRKPGRQAIETVSRAHWVQEELRLLQSGSHSVPSLHHRRPPDQTSRTWPPPLLSSQIVGRTSPVHSRAR